MTNVIERIPKQRIRPRQHRTDKMTNQSTSSSLWYTTASTPINAPALQGDVQADVAIIGGGYTGLSAALHLAEAGVRVCLLEARTIGYGGSGRNAGNLNAGLWTPPDDVEKILGEQAGKRLNALLASGPDAVFELAERYGIACEATRKGTMHLAHSKSGLSDLQSRYAQQIKRNAPVELLDASQTAQRTGSKAFYGALFDPRAGTIQPLSYARGLARAAQAAGASVFENSAAQTVSRSSGEWVVTTSSGTLTARHLVRATNAYGTALSDEAPRYTPVHYFQCATAPLSQDHLESILPAKEGCWDTGRVMTSFRVDQAGRLIIGAVGNLDSLGSSTHLAWAKRKLGRVFPQLSRQAFEFSWTGRIAMTSDHLPKVAPIGENGIEIFGYSGRGIAPGTLFGQAAADWVLNGSETAFSVAIQSPEAETRTGARAAYIEAGATATHLLNGRF